jgi:hypothetical protein
LSTGPATLLLAVNRVVDPDPVGFETPHPDTDPEKIIPDPESSGSELNLK